MILNVKYCCINNFIRAYLNYRNKNERDFVSLKHYGFSDLKKGCLMMAKLINPPSPEVDEDNCEISSINRYFLLHTWILQKKYGSLNYSAFFLSF